MLRRSVRFIIVALVLMGHPTPPAAASVDANGIFVLTGVPGLDSVSVRQVGGRLTLCAVGQGEIVKFATGGVDPSTGAFVVSWTLLGPGGLGAYCSVVWTGTFAPDGSSFTAQVEERSTCVPPPFSCQPACVVSANYAIAGMRLQATPAPCCGDGVPEGAEQCDDGNAAAGDCCAAACAFEPAGTVCQSGCDSKQCDGAGMCVSP